MDNNSEKKVAQIAIIAIFAIFILSIGVILYRNILADGHKKTATIYQNGTVIYTFKLEQVTTPQEITITGENGAYNTILVEPGCISMKDASCPDHLCVHMGKITNSTLPITCLPNKIVISISDSDTDAPDSFAY